MLKKGFRVSETAYKVGYNSPAHFSKIFKEKFGYKPKDHSGMKT
jgi:AraC-like DNA-binding protein